MEELAAAAGGFAAGVVTTLAVFRLVVYLLPKARRQLERDDTPPQ